MPGLPDLTTPLRDQTEALLRTAAGLTDLDAPSLCAGWRRAHVLSHLARNADGIINCVRAAHGDRVTMYASTQARDRDIEEGATRPAAVVLEDLTTTAHDALVELSTLHDVDEDTQVERFPGGPTFAAGDLPFLRLRELVYHHVDLDAGFGFGDVPAPLQEVFLVDEVERLRRHPDAPAVDIRTNEGDTWTVGAGGPEVTGPRAGVLTWLARGIPDGLDQPRPPALPEGR